MIKCDIQEPEGQTIVRYVGGLDPKYGNIVELQQYTTFDDVVSLLTRLSNKRRLSKFLSLQIKGLQSGTNPLTRGVPNRFLSHKILFHSIHKEPKHHKRPQHPQFDQTPIL